MNKPQDNFVKVFPVGVINSTFQIISTTSIQLAHIIDLKSILLLFLMTLNTKGQQAPFDVKNNRKKAYTYGLYA